MLSYICKCLSKSSDPCVDLTTDKSHMLILLDT